jgi:hypothetical protein
MEELKTLVPTEIELKYVNLDTEVYRWEYTLDKSALNSGQLEVLFEQMKRKFSDDIFRDCVQVDTKSMLDSLEHNGRTRIKFECMAVPRRR